MSKGKNSELQDERTAEVLQRLCESSALGPEQIRELEQQLDGLSLEELTDLLGAGQCLQWLYELGRTGPESADQIADRPATKNGNEEGPSDPDRHSAPETRETVHANERLASPDALPETIGPYRVLCLAARGGFATIYQAHDTRLDRLIALKVPLVERIVDASARRRFERESRMLATLNHPAIVPIYDVGTDDPLYIAMPWVPGQNLHEWLTQRRQSVPIAEAVIAIERIADAIAHAHARGILHRDLKPANILIEETADVDTPWSERLRVTDFGLAKLAEETTSGITVDDTIMGTPDYMSPEQVASPADVGPTSDVYSLGIILYELLTGKSPHRQTTFAATLRSVERDSPPRLRSLRRDIPRELVAICEKCLQKSPADRYPNASELAADLERFQDGRPVVASRPGPWRRIRKWAERNPLVAVSSSVTFATMIIGLVVALLMNQSLVRSRNRYARQVQILESVFQDLDRDAEENSLRESDLRERLARRLISSAELLDQNEDTETQVCLLLTISNSLDALGYPGQSVQFARRAMARAEGQFPENDGIHLRLELALARGLSAQDKFAEAIDVLEPIVARPDSLARLNDEERLRCLSLLAEARFQLASSDHRLRATARQDYEAILDELDRHSVDPSLDRRLRSMARFRLAVLKFQSSPNEHALQELQRQFDHYCDVYGEDHVLTIRAAYSVVPAIRRLGKFDRAIELASRSLDMARRRFGEADFTTLLAYDALLVSLAAERMTVRDAEEPGPLADLLPKAEACCRQVGEKYGSDHPSILAIYNNIAIAWNVIGDEERSIQTRRILLQTAEKTYGRNSPITQNQVFRLGSALALSGQAKEARSLLTEFITYATRGVAVQDGKLNLARHHLAALAKNADDDPETSE